MRPIFTLALSAALLLPSAPARGMQLRQSPDYTKAVQQAVEARRAGSSAEQTLLDVSKSVSLSERELLVAIREAGYRTGEAVQAVSRAMRLTTTLGATVLLQAGFPVVEVAGAYRTAGGTAAEVAAALRAVGEDVGKTFNVLERSGYERGGTSSAIRTAYDISANVFAAQLVGAGLNTQAVGECLRQAGFSMSETAAALRAAGADIVEIAAFLEGEGMPLVQVAGILRAAGFGTTAVGTALLAIADSHIAAGSALKEAGFDIIEIAMSFAAAETTAADGGLMLAQLGFAHAAVAIALNQAWQQNAPQIAAILADAGFSAQQALAALGEAFPLSIPREKFIAVLHGYGVDDAVRAAKEAGVPLKDAAKWAYEQVSDPDAVITALKDGYSATAPQLIDALAGLMSLGELAMRVQAITGAASATIASALAPHVQSAAELIELLTGSLSITPAEAAAIVAGIWK